MQDQINNIDKEVGHLDKEIAILSADYKNIADALNKTNEQLQDTNKLLNKFCTRLETQNVRVDGLEEDFKRYQQLTYGVIIGVVVFVIQQVVLMIH